MKRLALVLALLSCSHLAPLGTTKQKQIGMHFANDIKFDHDQIVVCVFVDDKSFLSCMTPEEYQFRSEAAKDLEPADPLDEPDSPPKTPAQGGMPCITDAGVNPNECTVP